jgi:SPP1 family predicted phage head-tail adaptor
MDVGELRERITIRRQSNTKNEQTGGLTRSWADVASVWAKVRSIDGREAVIGGVLQGIAHFEITVRYRDDIRSADQILWGSRELNIHTAEDRKNTKQWLTVMASTETPQGA